MADSNDLTNDYLAHRSELAAASGADEMVSWLRTRPGGVGAAAGDAASAASADPFPTDRSAPKRESTAGTVLRNIGEIPGQTIAGVEAALNNAIGWAINPLADWLNKNVADLSYTRDAPETTTGAITKSISQFLTGFIPAIKGLGAVGMGGAAANVTASAIADFATRDPHEKRLANLWQELKLPQNVLTDYLAADPKDSAIEGRFKSAIEAAGLGAVAEGVVAGARALRAARHVKGAQAAEDAALKAAYGELSPQAYRTIGDPAKPLIEAAPKQMPKAAVVGGKMSKAAKATAQVAADDLVGGRALIDAGESQVYVNFARINGPDEVKAVIGEMASRFAGSIDEAARGTITHAETQQLADDLGLTIADVVTRQKGGTWNAETALAARRLWASSGEKLLEAAKKAADPNAGPIDIFTFRKMMATHYAIQREVIGARTEAARALASWRIPAGSGMEQARQIEQLMSAMGGAGDSVLMARKLAAMGESGATPAAIGAFAEKGALATTADAIKEAWINGLLSSPTTHIVNSTSNLMVSFQQIYERAAAAQISQFTGSGAVVSGEATAMAYGAVSSIKDAFRLAWKSLKTGETGWSLNKVDLPLRKAISAETFGIASNTGMGRFVDFLGNAVRLPGRFLGAEDEFFKTVAYRAELHAQTLRQAVGEGLKGEALGRRMAQLLAETPQNLKINAADAALYATFTQEPGPIGQAIMSARNQVPGLTFIMPFVRTPVNIARYAFERTPLAPLVAQWRDAVRAGGAQADIALARMATGSAIMAMAMDWADSGLISGNGQRLAGDKDMREAMTRQGWQPYSIKIGTRWYSYNRLDPLGSTFGFAADIAEAIRRGEVDNDAKDRTEEVVAAAITAISQVTINKTYLQGMANFTEMMADPQRYSDRYITNFVTSFIPATALMGGIERAIDPTVREANTVREAVYAKIAGWSKELPPRRDLWGREVRTDSSAGTVYDFLTPARATDVKPNPIDAEIMRLGQGPERIKKKTTFHGVQVNLEDWPQVYDAYTRLAGNDLKHPAWNLGAMDYLNAVISGQHAMSRVYQMRSDEMKTSFVRETVAQYREMAQKAVLDDPQFATFADLVKMLREDKMQKRLPVMGPQS